MKHNLNERKCISCGNHYNKYEMIRVVKSKLNVFTLDTDKHLDGRGCYICKNINCINNCISKKMISKAFKTFVPQSVYDNLMVYFNESNQ